MMSTLTVSVIVLVTLMSAITYVYVFYKSMRLNIYSFIFKTITRLYNVPHTKIDKKDRSILITMLSLFVSIPLITIVVGVEYALPLALILVSIFVDTFHAAKVLVKAFEIRKEVVRVGSLSFVKLYIQCKHRISATICDNVDDVIVVNGDTCIDIDGSKAKIELRYTALDPLFRTSKARVLVEVKTLSGLRLLTSMAPSTIITHRHVPSRELIGRTIAGVEVAQPVVDYVKPYTFGDDLKLLIPKSILSVGGPKVKVLIREPEAGHAVCKSPPKIGIVVPRNYAVRRIGMIHILSAMKDLIGYRIDIESFERSVLGAIHYAEVDNIVLILEPNDVIPMLDLCIVIQPVNDRRIDYFPSLRSIVEKELKPIDLTLVKNRCREVVVFGASS